jgi:hypothetical protein
MKKRPSYLLEQSLDGEIIAMVKNENPNSNHRFDLYLRQGMDQFRYLGKTTLPLAMIRVYDAESLVAFECKFQLVTQNDKFVLAAREFCDKDDEEEIQDVIKVGKSEIGILIDRGNPSKSSMKYLVIDKSGHIKKTLEFPNFIQILSHSELWGLVVLDDRNGISFYNSELSLIPAKTIKLDFFDKVKIFENKISIFNHKNFNFRIFRLEKQGSLLNIRNSLNVNLTPIKEVMNFFPLEDNIFFETKSKGLCGAKISETKNQVYCTDMDDYLLSENIIQKDEKTFVSITYKRSLEQKKSVEFEFFQDQIKIIKESKESIGFKYK